MTNAFASIPEVSVETLSKRLAQPTELQLVDVREPEELAIASLAGFINLPLSQSQAWSAEIQQTLNPHQETLVLCHHGMRSAQMCNWLIQQGFTNVKNIAGGIHAYAVKVDPSVPTY
jgi:rhodanese-related sulfurtransferase